MTGRADSATGDAGARRASGPADAIARQIRLARAVAAMSGETVEIATTPKDEVWRDGLASLHRYRSTGPRPLGPLVILHGLIGRQTITDLEPERSLVRRLIAGGVDLFVMDWGNPNRADRHLDIADYALDWLGEALDRVAAITGRAPAVMGVCMGGVFALMQAARRPDRVAGLVAMVTPVDFHADTADPDPEHGILNLWTRSLEPDLIRAAIAERGCLPGEATGAIFQLVAPMRMVAKYGPDLADIADDPAALATFLRMERWLADRPDMPGAAAEQWLVDLYHDNALVRGRFAPDGAPIDLARVTCPVLEIHARDDHIVPAPCAAALAGLTGAASYRSLEVPTGHIGVFVSAKAQSVVPPAILDWLEGLDHAIGIDPTPLG